MWTKRFAAPVALAVALSIVPAMARAIEATVYKSPECGCCHGWVGYLRENGFDVRVKDMDDVTPVKNFFAQIPHPTVTSDRVRMLATGAYTRTYASVGFNGYVPLEAYDI